MEDNKNKFIKAFALLFCSLLAIFVVHEFVVPNPVSEGLLGLSTTRPSLSIPGTEADYGLSLEDFEGFKTYRQRLLDSFQEDFDVKLSDKICLSSEWSAVRTALNSLIGESKVTGLLNGIISSGNCPTLTKVLGADYRILKAVRALKALSDWTEDTVVVEPEQETSSLAKEAIKKISQTYKGMSKPVLSNIERNIIPNFLTIAHCKFYGSVDQCCTMTNLVGTIYYKAAYEDLCRYNMRSTILASNETYYNLYVYYGYPPSVAAPQASVDAFMATCYGNEELSF